VATLLLIETSSNVCSVALSANNKVIACNEHTEGKNHATVITLYIEETIKQAGILLNDIDAVVVDAGPGSYTGLRIGLSTAKGLCFALDKPLILVDSLTALCTGVLEHRKLKNMKTLICPVIDNRRDEIFYALYNSSGKILHPISLSKTGDEDFLQILKRDDIIFTGSGIDKVMKADTSNHSYTPIALSAKYLLKTAEEKFLKKDFADLAYSEPFYYKEVYINP
jgi:tRNA threonylcarbamoyladenosine biosynthesis protein TsaB